MFEFRIINLPDGSQIIDPALKTPYEALTPAQMVEYVEMDVQLDTMDRMEWKARAKAGHERKLVGNIAYRLACLCGLV